MKRPRQERMAALDAYPEDLATQEQRIAVAYYLHNLYCAFESMFQRVAEVFENAVADRTGWHADLLRRMTLDIEGVRRHLIRAATWDSLDELRRFRHLVSVQPSAVGIQPTPLLLQTCGSCPGDHCFYAHSDIGLMRR